MLEISNYPSALLKKVCAFESHPILQLIKEFGFEHIEDMLECSYLYLGPISKNSNAVVSILHYHSSLCSGYSFGDIQNLHSYERIEAISKESIKFLCLEIERDKVQDLSKNDSINTYLLNSMYKANRFIIVDETGFCRECYWEK